MRIFSPRRKAVIGDRRISYWGSDGAKVDFDPTEPDKRLEERLDRIEAIQFRMFLPRFREWQATYSQPFKVPS